jgi:hypothetical protein
LIAFGELRYFTGLFIPSTRDRTTVLPASCPG